jgi:hypothetical protein
LKRRPSGAKLSISILALERAAAAMADQKDVLDKTIHFLQKREGIDKVSIVLSVTLSVLVSIQQACTG